MNEFHRFDISWNTLWKIAIFFMMGIAVYFAREVFGIVFIAVILSIGLDPVVGFLERRGVPRLLAALAVFLAGFLVLAGMVYVLVPVISVEIGGFLTHFNKTIASLFGIKLSPSLIKNFNFGFEETLGFLSAAQVSLTTALSGLLKRLVMIFATVMISFYLTVEQNGPERLLRVLLPRNYERATLNVFTKFKVKVQRWFGTQLLLSILIGFMVWLGLWLLGVRYSLIIGMLAAIFELVPVIGPIITGAVAFLIAVSDSLSLGFYTILFFFIIQQLENHVFIPILLGKSVKVHPVVVITSILAGGYVAGFVGIVLAVPVAIMSQEIFNYLEERKDGRPELGI